MSNFTVRQQSFEGPLELLLTLIKKRKLHVSDVSLAQVTDDFIFYVQGADRHVDDTSKFVQTISTLLLLKSRSILPHVKLSVEEEREVEDLEERLQLYEKLVKVTRDLEIAFNEETTTLKKRRIKDNDKVEFTPTDEVQISSLHTAIRALLEKMPSPLKLPQARVVKKISLKEVLASLQARIESRFTTTFNEVSVDARDSLERVVHFLALLELVKGGIIIAEQDEPLSEIRIHKQQVTIPTYGS